MTNKCGRTRQRTNNLRDEMIWGMNSASELATVYYHTRIRGGSPSTPPGGKGWCIIAPIERYSGYRHFQWKRKSCNHRYPDSVYFHTLLLIIYTTQNLLRITFSFNDLMLKTNRLKKDFFYKDRLIFGLDDPVANMSIRHVYYAWGAREKTYPLKRVSFCLVSASALVHLANFQLIYHKF